MTACDKCLFSQTWLLTYFCIAKDEDVFDFRSGQYVKAFKKKLFIGYSDVASLPLCQDKNKGDCADFKPNEPPI